MSTRRFAFSFTGAAALLLAALGCGVHDQTGKDTPGATPSGSANRADASVGKQASSGAHAAGANQGGSGTGADAGGPGSASKSGAGSGGSSGSGNAGSHSAGTGGTPATSDAGPAKDAGSMSANTPQDPECDLNGIWIARLTTFSRDTVLSNIQTASNWYYYEIAQSGREVTITAALDCGIQVSGSADVTINGATTQALLTRNDQKGRKGTFEKDGDHCSLKIDRFYSTRGASRSTYLNADLSQRPELSSLTPALPTQAAPQGNEDWDGDGNPGIAFNVRDLGSRHVVQRDWNEFFSDTSYQVSFQADKFVVRALFDSQEEILATTGTFGGLLVAGSAPAAGALHRITFQRLGRDKSDPKVSAVRVADPLQSCFNVQDALPHDSTSM